MVFGDRLYVGVSRVATTLFWGGGMLNEQRHPPKGQQQKLHIYKTMYVSRAAEAFEGFQDARLAHTRGNTAIFN